MREFNKLKQNILCVLALLLCGGSALHGYEIPTDGWLMKGGLHQPGFTDGTIVSLNFTSYSEQIDPEAKFLAFTLEKKFTLSSKEYFKLKDSAPEFYIAYISNVYTVFFNGEKVHSSGKMGESKVLRNGFARNKRIPLSPGKLVSGENTVTVQVSGAFNDEVYLNKPILLEEAAVNQAANDDSDLLMLAALYTVLGFYHLQLYGKRRQEDYNLWFSLFSLCLGMYIVSGSSITNDIALDPLWIKRWEWASIGFIFPLAFTFFTRFLRFRAGTTINRGAPERSGFGYLSIIAILQVVNLFLENGQLKTTLYISHGVTCLLIIALFPMITWKGITQRKENGLGIFLGYIVMIGSFVFDILGAMGVQGLNNYEVSKYGFMIFVIAISLAATNRTSRQMKEEKDSFDPNFENKF